MNNKEFIAELARRSGYTQADTQKMASAFIAEMAARFEEGESIQVTNFGTFDVKKRLERVVVNPATQQRMLVPPKLILGFRPVAAVKEQLKNT